MKTQQSVEELRQHFVEQIGFLSRSADAYDAGHRDESKRLAVTTRLLVHDTATSRSLLGQLGEKQRLFHDTAVADETGNILSHGALIQMAFGPLGAEYYPYLDDALPFGQPRGVEFEDWWSRAVFRNAEAQELSRKALVLAVANQDGGAHVDPRLDAVYAKLSRENSMGWNFVSHSVTYPVRPAEQAAVRQIAHEVLKTFDPQLERHPAVPEGSVLFAAASLRDATPEEVEQLESERVANSKTSAGFRQIPKTQRNEPCPCGSGRKFKKCHGGG